MSLDAVLVAVAVLAAAGYLLFTFVPRSRRKSACGGACKCASLERPR
jgi:hypothetical protein